MIEKEEFSFWSVAMIRSYSHFLIKRNYEVYFSRWLPGIVEFYIPYIESEYGRKIILYSDYLFFKVNNSFDFREWKNKEVFLKSFFLDVSKEKLYRIPKEEMDNFMQKVQEYILAKKFQQKELVVNKVVLVKKGFFAGSYGIVKDVREKEVKVLLEDFKVSVWIKKDYLEVL